jgi:hypothetical protein
MSVPQDFALLDLHHSESRVLMHVMTRGRKATTWAALGGITMDESLALVLQMPRSTANSARNSLRAKGLVRFANDPARQELLIIEWDEVRRQLKQARTQCDIRMALGVDWWKRAVAVMPEKKVYERYTHWLTGFTNGGIEGEEGFLTPRQIKAQTRYNMHAEIMEREALPRPKLRPVTSRHTQL